jgi:hypothetical protein
LTPKQYEEFLHEALHELNALKDRSRSSFSLGLWERWDYEEDRGRITFSSNGIPKVIAEVLVVGTTSVIEGTWLWGWANKSTPAALTRALSAVRAFGEAEGLPVLTEPSWPADEYHGWEMTAIAAKLVGAKGAYRTPRTTGGHSYYLFTDLGFVDGGSPKRPTSERPH